MGIRLTSRRILAGYAVWMALLVVAHYTLAGQRTATAALIEVSGVAAMVAGVSINRPARRTPWLLLAAANLTGTLGEVASHVYSTVTHAPVPFPSFADVIYLAAYPLYVAGLAMFIRSRSTGPDARSTIDALNSLTDRLDLDEARSFVLVLRQSVELGSDVAESLRIFSDEMRDKRIMRAEESANKLPVKMVAPLGLLIFPVILMVVMLPLALRVMAVLPH